MFLILPVRHQARMEVAVPCISDNGKFQTPRLADLLDPSDESGDLAPGNGYILSHDGRTRAEEGGKARPAREPIAISLFLILSDPYFLSAVPLANSLDLPRILLHCLGNAIHLKQQERLGILGQSHGLKPLNALYHPLF